MMRMTQHPSVLNECSAHTICFRLLGEAFMVSRDAGVGMCVCRCMLDSVREDCMDVAAERLLEHHEDDTTSIGAQ